MNLNALKEISFVFYIFVGILLDSALSLTVSQQAAVKLLNETFVVICRDEQGSKVDWTGPKGVLGMKTRPKVSTATFGTSMLFNQTKAEDSGVYTCSSKNEKKTFRLTVEAPLSFMDSPLEQETQEGVDKVVRCEVRGGQVTWSTLDGEELKAPKYKVIADGLVIKNVTRHDSKTYVCKAVQSSTGIIEDRKIRLTVQHKPVFLYHYAKQETAFGYIGGTVNLTCEVSAEPPPKFVWYDLTKKARVPGIEVSPHTSVLQIKVDRRSFGNYKCTVTNSMGKLEKFFSLEEGSKPDPPRSVELRSSNSEFLDLVIVPPELPENRDDSMDPKGYSVEYREANTENDWNSQQFNITEENIYPLVDLQPDTDYEVRAATRNVAGLSDFTNSSIFKTLPSGAGSLYTPFVILNIIVLHLCIVLIGN